MRLESHEFDFARACALRLQIHHNKRDRHLIQLTGFAVAKAFNGELLDSDGESKTAADSDYVTI